jgi:hypothetical protein
LVRFLFDRDMTLFSRIVRDRDAPDADEKPGLRAAA